MPTAALVAGASILGLILGSFGTMVAHRVGYGKPLNEPKRSACPECGRTITWRENIPLVSYLVQRGRCLGCGARIGLRYPLAEAGTAILFGLAAWRFEASIETVVFAALFWVLVVLTVIDIEHQLLPNRVVFPAIAAGFAGLAVAAIASGEPERLNDAVIGAFVFGGFMFLVSFIYPAGMGGGDVKLSFLLGAFLGYVGSIGATVVGAFLAFVFGSVVGIVAMRVSGRGRKMKIPFGPFLALGTVVAVFVGRQIADWYLGRL